MNVLIEWTDGMRTQAHPNIERVVLLEDHLSERVALPEKGVLYVNPQNVRTLRVVDDQETRGDQLASILFMQADRQDGESLTDLLLRIIRERDQALAMVDQQLGEPVA